MDKSNIQILREDLTEEFQALAQAHTTAIVTLLEEFNGDQLLHAIETKGYEREHLQVEKEVVASSQASTEVLPENATQEPKEEDVMHPEQEQSPATEQDKEPKQEEATQQDVAQ